MKYLIELEPIKGTNLYKAKGFNTLVFDEYGLQQLTPVEEFRRIPAIGDTIRTENGTTLYEFKGYDKDGRINAVNKSNGMFVNLRHNHIIVVDGEDSYTIECERNDAD